MTTWAIARGQWLLHGSRSLSHARGRMLRTLAKEELGILEDVLDRWEGADHPPGSIPSSSDLEPTDSGIMVGPETKTLVARPDEWEVFQRVSQQLR